MGAVEVERVRLEEALHNHQRFLEAAYRLLVRKPESGVLAFGVACSQPQHQSAIADVIDGHGDLREEADVAVTSASDEGADCQARNRNSKRAEHREALQIAFQLNLGVIRKVHTGASL